MLGSSHAQKHGLVHRKQTLLQSQCSNFTLGVRTGHFTNDENMLIIVLAHNLCEENIIKL